VANKHVASFGRQDAWCALFLPCHLDVYWWAEWVESYLELSANHRECCVLSEVGTVWLCHAVMMMMIQSRVLFRCAWRMCLYITSLMNWVCVFVRVYFDVSCYAVGPVIHTLKSDWVLTSRCVHDWWADITWHAMGAVHSNQHARAANRQVYLSKCTMSSSFRSTRAEVSEEVLATRARRVASALFVCLL